MSGQLMRIMVTISLHTPCNDLSVGQADVPVEAALKAMTQ